MGVSDKSDRLTTGEKSLLDRWRSSSKSAEQDAQLVVTPEAQSKEGRRLAAVMFTDMVGYTALTQRDEALALEILEDHRSLVRPLLRRYSGREIKTVGDGFIVEFPSALEAVQCSLAIQLAVSNYNSNRSPEKRFNIRIGIHVGDVIHKDKDVYGDTVNIASRLTPFCVPGSVCVTEQVHLQVRNKLDKPFVKIGRRKLKNVEAPLLLYTLKF